MSLILALLACSSSSDAELILAGSSTIRPLAEVAAEAFEAGHPGVRVTVQGGGSGVGVASARSGLADVGMVSRALTAEEADLIPRRIARDGIAVICNGARAEVELSTEQIVAIYTGETEQWPDGRAITVVNKEEGRSTRSLFEHHYGLDGRFRDDLVVIGPNGQAIATVAADRDAVAYVSIGSAVQAEAAGVAIRRVPIDGIEPSVAAVAAGSWPLSRELNLVTAGQPEGLAAEFMDFLLSAEGQGLVVAEDFVPVGDAAP